MYVHVEASNHTPPCIIAHLAARDYRWVDDFSRALALKAFVLETSSLDQESLWRLVDRITGGLGYTSEGIDEARVIIAGCVIAWTEAVDRDSIVLEIGTGLGRTMHCLLESTKPRMVLTVDNSPEILSIALYRNPFPYFQEKLWRDNVYIVYGDAVEVVDTLLATRHRFNHIIHDGGPNPGKNKRLYNREFLEKLVRLLQPKGTLSVFTGRNPRETTRIYKILKRQGLEIETKTLPYSPARVIHAKKP